MTDPLDAALERALARGESVAVARILSGGRAGARLLIWPGGQAFGDLGSPRLNQRVALYAEGLIARGGRERKRFDSAGGDLVIETAVVGPEAADA